MPEPTTEKKETEGNLPEPVVEVLKEIREKLDKVKEPPKDTEVPKQPTYADERASLQKRLGFTDEQMRAHEETIIRSQAPQIEATGWASLEKKHDLDKYRAEIAEELKLYPQERRDPVIMEKIYHMVKGKHADSQPPKKDEPKTERVRSGPGYDGGGPGMPSGGGDGSTAGDDEKLSDVEKMVAAKLGVNEKDYAKSRNAGRTIKELKVSEDFKPTSKADVELRRLMGVR